MRVCGGSSTHGGGQLLSQEATDCPILAYYGQCQQATAVLWKPTLVDSLGQE